MRKIRKNDTVRVLGGRDRGKTGKVISVVDQGTRATVEKCNMVKRHTKPTDDNVAGGIIEKEAPIYVSKLALVSSAGEPVRVGFRIEDGRKVRYARKVDETFE